MTLDLDFKVTEMPSTNCVRSDLFAIAKFLCNTVLGKRRFSVAAPLVWNSLPLDLIELLILYQLLRIT